MKKEFLQAVGDGVSTLLDLIKQSNVVRFRLNGLMKKHESNLGKILSKEEVYILSYALNLNRGCKLVSLAHEKDERLLHVFD